MTRAPATFPDEPESEPQRRTISARTVYARGLPNGTWTATPWPVDESSITVTTRGIVHQSYVVLEYR